MLVNCYVMLHEEMAESRNSILQDFIARCFELMQTDDAVTVKRIVRILAATIKISEKKGTAGVQPHNALLLGEELDRVIVNYKVQT